MKVDRSRALLAFGLLLMIAGALDPLEGSIVILAGSLAAAAGAYLRSLHRHRLPVLALAMITAGVASLFALSTLGGVGGTTGRSLWWLLLCAPYPVGWVLGLVGAARALRAPRVA